MNLINGNFITLDDSCPHAESISIENGKICGINAIDHNCENLNLKGATIIPGFIDAHFHLTNLGKQLDTLQLKKCTSKHQIADLVLQKSNEIDDEDWIIGSGWDQTRWPNACFPEKETLDDLNIKNPVFLTRIDGHSSWVNNISMKMSGLNIKADPPDGGKIINDCILIDNAMNPVKKIIPKSKMKTIEKWMKLAFDIIVSRGITNIHDAWQDPITIDTLKKIDSKGELPIRC